MLEDKDNQSLAAGFRLSPQQKHLWKRQGREERPSFCAQAVALIEGRSDPETLHAALQNVLARHEILRTTFRERPGSPFPVQVIEATASRRNEEHDLSALSAARQQAEIEALLPRARAARWNWENGPLVRIAHVRLSPRQRLVVLTLPALCADAVSLDNLVRELGRCYQARLRNEDCGAGAMQYADVAEWQNQLLEAEEGELGRAFWRKQNFYPLPHAQLPFEKPPTAETRFHALVLRETMPGELTAKIAASAQRHHASVATVLASCFKILLWRLAGAESEIVIGLGHSGRKYDELRGAVGLFAKYLPVRSSLQASSRFGEVLAQLHEAAQEIDAWQDSFSWESLNGTGDQDAPPFLPFCFDFLAAGEKFSTGELSFSVLQQYVCVDRFKIKFVGIQHDEALRFELHYDANIYDADDMQRFAAQFRALLENALDHAEAPIRELNIMPAAERRRLLFDFNNTAADYPRDQCLHEVIAAQARLAPESVAVIFNDLALTYGELNARANQLAHRLRHMRVGPNVLVGICIERSLEMIISVLAVLKAGGAYLPLDPAYPPERLRLMLEDTQAPVLLTKKLTIDNYQLSIVNLKLQAVCLDTDWEAIAQESRANPATNVIPENLVYVIYTSGSTGKPKGVMISHLDLIISNLARIAYFKQPMHKFLLLSSLSFDSSVVGIFWTLCEGGTLFLVPEAQQQNMVELTEIIATHRISHVLTLPSLYALILEYAKPQPIACLQTVIVAGEACPKKMVEHHKAMLPNVALFSEYGATETTVFSSVYDCRKQTLNLAPVGDPIANAQMYVLDSWQQPQPVNVPGEVYFGGEALSKGYLNRPDLTAERFIPHRFSAKPGERLYKSGDLARHLANGDLEFLGRIDNQVKVRGFRIELEEIEAALAQHPAVGEAAVVAREVTPGSKRLIAYVAASQRQAVTIGELRRYLAALLPDYMVPATFVIMESLPKNPNGKIDRRALPDPGPERPELEESFVAAQTGVEMKLAEIWAAVLRLEKVGVHDNFFELGGDSILSIQIISKARQAGLHLTPVQMFQHQTIAELAKVVGEQRACNAEQGLVTGSLPLTPIQHWLFEKNLPDPNHWNVSLLLEMRREISARHLRQAAQHLLRHHDALRMRYINAEGWQQTVAGIDQAVPLDRVEVSAFQHEEQMAAIEEKTAAFQAQLHLAEGPLMRFVWFERGPGQNPYLLWVLHHLVCDVVSWRIMLEDLQTAIEQLGRGATVQLPAKTTSFKHWAERLVEYAQSKAVKDERDYWLTALPERIPSLPLDYQHGIEVNTEESTRTVKVFLDAGETRALLQEVPKIFNTQINEVLLAAFAHAFIRWTGEPSVLIDLEGHGREDIFPEIDLSRTVGWFTIFYPVCLKVHDGGEVGETLRAVKAQLRRIPNRGFGYGLLRYANAALGIAEKMRRLPSAQINFNYLGQFDQSLQESSAFTLVQETNIYDRSPKGSRSHMLEIVGMIVHGVLQVEWSYSENLHRTETITALAHAMMENLRAIIRQGRAAEEKPFMPADFADFGWDQADLENIAEAILQSKTEN